MQATTHSDRVLTHMIQKIKRMSNHSQPDFQLTSVANSSVSTGYLNGKQVKRIIFYLRGVGCSWCKLDYGGCAMCGHFHGTTKGGLMPESAHLDQFKKEYKKYDFSEYPIVCIYNAGSLLSREEVRDYDFSEILKIIDSDKNIKHVIVESRPEFITDDTMEVMKKCLKTTSVEIGIGLESSSEVVRDLCINKGFSFREYQRAAEIVKKYKFKLLTYITVKPLFLTINESISDVIQSLEAISHLTDVVSLEPTSIQKGTLVDYFYSAGIYRIPSGWMLRDIICRLRNKIETFGFELRIGGFEFYPTPQLYVSNCYRCNGDLYNAINIFNVTKKIDAIIDLKCECENTYEMEKNKEQLSKRATSLDTRIAEIIADTLLEKYLTH
jgi:radical SAM enzyme (TIGR01210 family)